MNENNDVDEETPCTMNQNTNSAVIQLILFINTGKQNKRSFGSKKVFFYPKAKNNPQVYNFMITFMNYSNLHQYLYKNLTFQA